MMQRISFPERSEWAALAQRPKSGYDDILPQVASIMAEVRRDGDSALFRLARRLDGAKLDSLALNDSERAAADTVDTELMDAIRVAAANIRRFHEAQPSAEYEIETMPGIRCSRRTTPIRRVGLYIPGGTAPLFSTLLMLGIPALIAGCEEILICTPPQADGTVNATILAVARVLGLTRIFKIGGAGAIAAMAYGTDTVPKVDKIFGPGNRYVTAAKLLAGSQGVAIDMPAGPSELAVIVDRTSVPAFVAADLLSQAEHGPDSQVLLLSDDAEVIDAVQNQLASQLEALPRRNVAVAALANSRAILFRTVDEALDFSNGYAPEHLILACRDYERLALAVRNAGSVFLGNYAPESAGDYASGTNHALPTGGGALAWSGISVASFQKTISFQEISREGLAGISATVGCMAEAEGLRAHAAAITIRKTFNDQA